MLYSQIGAKEGFLMAYVAVSGGEEAIAASTRLLDYYRSGTDKDLELEAIAD